LTPPNPPKPRQPSRPDLQAAVVDKLVGRATDLVGATTRKQTFTGLGAMVLPAAPLERADTVLAPPATSATLPAAPETSNQVAGDESAPGSLPGDQTALLRDELAKTRADLAQARRDARAAAEAKLETYPPQIVESVRPPPAPPAPAPVPPTDSIRPDGTLATLRKAQTRLYVGLAAFAAVIAVPLAGWLQATADTRAKSDRADVKADSAKTTAEDAKAKAGTNAKAAATLEQEFRQHRANEREVWRLLGVDVPKADGDPEPENLEPMTPYCAAGKVCTGPQLVLRKSP